MGRELGKAVLVDTGTVVSAGPVAGDILRGDTVSITTAVETQLFDSPGALLAELESRGYLWSWGYCTESIQHGMVTWRIVLRADLKIPVASDLLAASKPHLPKDAICSAGVPEARLHPNTALSITAFSPGAVASCRRWLAADFLPRALPRLLGLAPSPAGRQQGARKTFSRPSSSAPDFTAGPAHAASVACPELRLPVRAPSD